MTFAIRTAAVGTVVGRQVVDVTFRMTSSYAAAIGADDDLYLDDGVAGGPVAPPPFAVVLEWPMLLRQPYIGLIGASEEGFFACLLHAFQDTHFHRAIRPGERVETVATLAAVRPTGAGALVVCRVDTRATASGEALTTSWIGSLFRACPLAGEAASAFDAPILPPTVDSAAWPFEPVAISRLLPFVYTECSGHWNPIHTERAFARAAGYPDLVVHGTSTWAIACQRLMRRHAQGRPERLRRFGARFSGVLTPDQTIRVAHAPSSTTQGAVPFEASDAAGRSILSHGIAEFGERT